MARWLVVVAGFCVGTMAGFLTGSFAALVAAEADDAAWEPEPHTIPLGELFAAQVAASAAPRVPPLLRLADAMAAAGDARDVQLSVPELTEFLSDAAVRSGVDVVDSR